MRDFVEPVAKALTCLSPRLNFQVIVAGDDAVELGPLRAADADHLQEAAQMVRTTPFEGGCDNVPALLRALELAQTRTNCSVVWLHGVQPPGSAGLQELATKWRRGVPRVRLYNLQLTPGPDAISRVFDEEDFVTTVPSFGEARQELRRLIVSLSPGTQTLEFRRRRTSDPPAAHELRAPPHLALLLAQDEILEMLSSRDSNARAAAARLASRYQLVTPVTGAVVLETRQQYDQAGLQPVDPDSAPDLFATPEPGTWGLMLAGALILLLRARQPTAASRRHRT